MRLVSLRRSVCLLVSAPALLCLWLTPAAAAEEGDFLNLQRRITEIVSEKASGVVRVKAATEQPEESGQNRVSLRVGTGFFISREGHVLTHTSVAMDASRVWVELDGIPYAADYLGSDPETNISLLKLMVLPEEFSYFPVSATHSKPRVGSLVLAITRPQEFEPSPTLGMVTGHESSYAQRVFPVTYIRVNILAYPGDPGSPVVDLNGRLIGIMVHSLPEVGSSYLLPAKALVNVRDELLFSGEVKHGWTGMEVEERADRQLGRHVVIQTVHPDSPAAKAGLKPGDHLVKMGDTVIRRAHDERNVNFFQRVGDYVEVQVKREGQLVAFPVKMAERPALTRPVAETSVASEGIYLAPQEQ